MSDKKASGKFDLSLMQEDVKKHEQGSPCYMPIEEDADPETVGYFNVRRVNTPEYQKQIEEIKLELFGFSSPEIDHALIAAHWLAEYGVTGWGNIIDEHEKDIVFSKSTARQIFLNPSFKMSLNSILISHGANYNNYIYDEAREDAEAVKKN